MKKEVQKINIILRHVENIKNFLADMPEEDFHNSTEKQQASMYCLMVIRENVKELLKTDNSFIDRHKGIHWGDLERFCDQVSHHYDTINAAILFEICKTNIPPLEKAIQQEKSVY